MDSVFSDLRKREDLISHRLLQSIEQASPGRFTQDDIVAILEKNGFVLASRDLVGDMVGTRAQRALDAYRTGAEYVAVGDVFWDTSSDIRRCRGASLPRGVTWVSTTPRPDKNPAYRFDPEAEGDQLSETMGLDPDDNTWTLRHVALTVWASGAGQA